MTNPFRSLPSVERVMSESRVQSLVESFSWQAVLDLARARLKDARSAITDGERAPDIDDLVRDIERRAASRWTWWPSSVINATGVILHTNLGRAPLSHDAIEATMRAARDYSDLELDLASGRRGSRQAYVARLLCQLTGAESALVVNNNASVVLLGLTAMAAGKEVIVSRGEAVEIGGGFRIPDVLRQSGAILVEVGTTNRTYARDYETAMTERTGAILSVHASNFKVTGFTYSPEIAELVELGKKYDVPVLHDLGSGCLLETARFGLAHEATPQESVRAGVGMTFFSGDKLLGGPQAGIVVGTRDLVGAVSSHPLARAVRIDKLSMAALSATLLHYVKEEVEAEVPIWRMISMTDDELRVRADRWAESIGPPAEVARSASTVGGGSMPGETLPSWVLNLDTGSVDGGAEELAKRLRQGDTPVVGRIEEDRVLLDPRTVLPDDERAFLRAVRHATGRGGED